MTPATTTAPPETSARPAPAPRDPRHARVAVIGAGFAGLAAVHALREAGITDFVVLERAASVGGVWRDNTYPGIACDVPSHLYSLSFAPNPEWRRTFSRGDQIHAYARNVAAQLRMDEVTQFGEELLEARWDAGHARWALRTTTLELTASVLIDGSGSLVDPSLPAIPGLDRFAGALFHSARWDHGQELSGKRVAVIGTGASAVQIVPAIAPEAGRVTVFQRTPGWVLPRVDRDTTAVERRLLRAVPGLQRAIRAGQAAYRDSVLLRFTDSRATRRVLQAFSRAYLRRTIDDPATRAKLLPDFEIGCKRILLTSAWYPALNRPNVHVEVAPITEVRAHSVVCADGTEHAVDAIVCATGFETSAPPTAAAIRGRDGRTLGETWGATPRAYRGSTTANFPNLFRLGGVGTGTGHFSQIAQIESGLAYAMDALRLMKERGLASVEVGEDAQDAYTRTIHRMAAKTVWVTGGCNSWYLDGSGHTTLWPGSARRYRRWTAAFDIDAYRAVPLAGAPITTPITTPAAA